jgi:sigma-B regulation protein RsbU (phosphoserine phosphatase)
MVADDRHAERGKRPGAVTPRWQPSLTFRLGLAISTATILVLACFWLLEYRRERAAHLTEQIERLREEGRVLRVAQGRLDNPAEFQAYIDEYCRQMERRISPGHHIIVRSPGGYIITRAHERAAAALEREMIQTPEGGWRRFPYNDHPHVAVGVKGVGGTTIVVSQSLAPVQRVIRRLAVDRAISIAILIVILLVTINVLLVRWVRRPIQDLVRGVQWIASGDFDRRIQETGSAELRLLENGFNEMASSLQGADRRRRQEMEKAERIHFSLLPAPELEIPGATWAASYVPAETIGGDYYDILPCPDGRYLIVIADVSGHGVPAALISAMVKALLRQAVHRGLDLLGTIRLVDQELTSLTGSEHFVTFLAVLYDPASDRIEYLNCGHEPALVVSSNGRARQPVTSAGLPLGIMIHSDRETGSAALKPGERLYLWTDGLTELPGPGEQVLGRDRLFGLFLNPGEADARHAVDEVMDEARRFHGSGSFPDDATLVSLWRTA